MATIKRGLYLTEEAQEPLHAQEERSARPAAQQPLGSFERAYGDPGSSEGSYGDLRKGPVVTLERGLWQPSEGAYGDHQKGPIPDRRGPGAPARAGGGLHPSRRAAAPRRPARGAPPCDGLGFRVKERVL